MRLRIWIAAALAALLAGCAGSENSGGKAGAAPHEAVQTFTAPPEAIATVAVLDRLLKEGYTVLDTASGDLNLDAYPDKILIMKKNGEDTLSGALRPLLILAGLGHGQYKFETRNDSVVMCRDCGGVFGDPYEHTTIKKGYFSIEHYGGSNWRWSRVITFKYLKGINHWVLHRDAGESYHTSEPDKTEEIVNNKADFDKLPFERFSYEKGM